MNISLKLAVLGLALMAVVALSGCSVSSAGLAPSTVPVKDTNYTVISQEDVSGSSYTVHLGNLISLSEASTAKSRDRALNTASADALIDVTSSNHKYFLPFLTIDRIKVSGKPIKFN